MPQAGAALWGQDPDVTAALVFLHTLADIAVTVVASADALLSSAKDDNIDALIVDCSTGCDALDRCLPIITQTTTPTTVCHPRQSFVDDLSPLAHGPLLWFPPEWTGRIVVEKARTFLAQKRIKKEAGEENVAFRCAACAANSTDLSQLTPRQRQVQLLVMRGYSNDEIAAQLGITQHTIKHHVTDGMSRLGVHTRHAFGVAARGQASGPTLT